MKDFNIITNPRLDQIGELATFSAFGDKVVRKFKILIVGVGGTGGYVLRDLARFLYSIERRTEDYEIELSIVDPDLVEEKNLLRQNFAPTDLGQNKANVSAARLSRMFGLSIKSYAEKMDFQFLNKIRGSENTPLLIVGCVDNNDARREINKYMGMRHKNVYWIDSGNEKSSGQVIFGDGNDVPMVTDMFPEICEESQDSKSEVSCAERLMQDEQNIFVNVTAAMYTLNFIRVIVLNEKTNIFGVRFNIMGKTDCYCLGYPVEDN